MTTTRLDEQQIFAEENGWGNAEIFPLKSDASFRTYSRLVDGDKSCLLMDAPPAHEDLGAYLKVQAHLQSLGLRAPDVYASNIKSGLALVEDFGTGTFTNLLNQGADRTALYLLATDVLVHLRKQGGGADLDVPAYDMAALLREVDLFIDWFVPAVYGRDVESVEREGWHSVWSSVLEHVSTARSSLVLRDYHVDNLMLLEGSEGVAACGLLDFQDALIGSHVYDLVSLVEDARLDVSEDLYEAVLNHYLAGCPDLDKDQLLEDMAILGAQRHAKVAGIFVRLSRRDGKNIYLGHIPRVLRLLGRALEHPVMLPVKTFMDQHYPDYASKVVEEV